MSKVDLNGRKVTVLRMIDQDIQIPGYGLIRNPITNMTKSKDDTDMVVCTQGVLVTFKTLEKARPILIAWGNIRAAQLEDETNS